MRWTEIVKLPAGSGNYLCATVSAIWSWSRDESYAFLPLRILALRYLPGNSSYRKGVNTNESILLCRWRKVCNGDSFFNRPWWNRCDKGIKTFIQAFIPVVIAAFQVADFTNWDQIKSIGYSALISAAAAGLSAVWNFVLGILPEGKSE